MAPTLSCLLTVPVQSNFYFQPFSADNRLEDEDGEIVSSELSECGKKGVSQRADFSFIPAGRKHFHLPEDVQSIGPAVASVERISRFT